MAKIYLRRVYTKDNNCNKSKCYLHNYPFGSSYVCGNKYEACKCSYYEKVSRDELQERELK